MRLLSKLVICTIVLLASGCASFRSSNVGLRVLPTDTAYPNHTYAEDIGGKLHVCIEPEKLPINSSPWYAFRIYSEQQEDVQICLDYKAGRHRYVPKYSLNGNTWQPFHPSEYQLLADGKELRLQFTKPPGKMDIAAQEIKGCADNLALLKELAENPMCRLCTVGYSVQGRPLHALLSQAPNPERPLLILLGRQHPPEVPGAMAMESFLHELFSDSPEALRFREMVNIIAVPMLNPDGVCAGHWRCNKNGRDLNRDWGRFAQPETAAVNAIVEDMVAKGFKPLMMIDFHSTTKDLLYTQLDSSKVDPKQLVKRWHTQICKGITPHSFLRKPSKTKSPRTAKAYFAKHYSIPSVTLEIGDETERQLVKQIGRVAAVELMKVHLEDQAA